MERTGVKDGKRSLVAPATFCRMISSVSYSCSMMPAGRQFFMELPGGKIKRHPQGSEGVVLAANRNDPLRLTARVRPARLPKD